MAIENIEPKKCIKCNEPYPATPKYFHKNKASKHGVIGTCKKCMKTINRANYEKRRHLEGLRKKPTKAVPKKPIAIKNRYKVGQDILFKFTGNGPGSRADDYREATITGKYEHLMAVKTKHYTTSISYRDILTGDAKVKVI